MQDQTPILRPLGRRRHLALALGLALGISVSASATASPQAGTDRMAARDNGAMLASSTVSGESAPAIKANQAPASGSVGAATTATITVTQCTDNYGPGTLRTAVLNANDGDTIDMSGMTSCTIDLSSSIVTSVDNLTIQGDPNSKYPILDGQDALVPIKHSGNGTITLNNIRIQHGVFTTGTPATRGGCVFSSGGIDLNGVSVKYCRAENTANGTAQGGAIAAMGNVSLDNESLIMSNQAVNSATGAAQGGAIWAQGKVTLGGGSIVVNNTALTYNAGGAHGGGIFSGTTTTINGQSIIDNNTAESYGSGSVRGGGVFATGTLTVGGNSTISNNEARAGTGTAWGGGAITNGDAIVKYSQVEDNLAYSASSSSMGGGLKTSETLMTKYTTISGNEANSGSSFGFGGGAHIGGNVSLRMTTISGNTAHVVGGLDLIGTNATQNLIIDQSTISGNTSTRSLFGAGLYAGHATNIRNSTITGNVESNASDTKYGAGLSVKTGVNVDLSSTLIAGNLLKKTDSTMIDSDIEAAVGGSNATLSGSHNLVGFSSLSTPGDTIVTLVDQVKPLADNGGLTQTHALLPGSDAIHAGKSNSFTSDQRGTGFKRVAGPYADIGAFEVRGDTIFADGFESP